jgi:hypothetical protein
VIDSELAKIEKSEHIHYIWTSTTRSNIDLAIAYSRTLSPPHKDLADLYNKLIIEECRVRAELLGQAAPSSFISIDDADANKNEERAAILNKHVPNESTPPKQKALYERWQELVRAREGVKAASMILSL